MSQVFSEDDLVLVLMEIRNERWEVSEAPVMRVHSFCQHFSRKEF